MALRGEQSFPVILALRYVDCAMRCNPGTASAAWGPPDRADRNLVALAGAYGGASVVAGTMADIGETLPPLAASSTA